MAFDYIFITMDNGTYPEYSLSKNKINIQNQQYISFGWNSILVDTIQHIAPNKTKNIIFKVPLNTQIITSNVANTQYFYLGDFEVTNVLDFNEHNDIYDIKFDDIEIKNDVYIGSITVVFK